MTNVQHQEDHTDVDNRLIALYNEANLVWTLRTLEKYSPEQLFHHFKLGSGFTNIIQQ